MNIQVADCCSCEQCGCWCLPLCGSSFQTLFTIFFWFKVFILLFFHYYFSPLEMSMQCCFCDCCFVFVWSHSHIWNSHFILNDRFYFFSPFLVKSNYVFERLMLQPLWYLARGSGLPVVCVIIFFSNYKSVSVTRWVSSASTEERDVRRWHYRTWCVSSVHSETGERHWPQVELAVGEAAGWWGQDARILRGVQRGHWDGTDHSWKRQNRH